MGEGGDLRRVNGLVILHAKHAVVHSELGWTVLSVYHGLIRSTVSLDAG